jgi:hypothetical protein
MTGPFFFQRRSVVNDLAAESQANDSLHVTTQSQESVNATALLGRDRGFAESPTVPHSEGPASYQSDQADPTTLLHDGREVRDDGVPAELPVDPQPPTPTRANGQDAASEAPIRVCPKCAAQSQVVGGFCPHCGAGFTGKRLRKASKRPAASIDPSSARGLRPQEQATSTMTRAQQIVVPLVGALALVGVGLGLLALTSAPSTAPLQHQLNVLRAAAVSQGQEIEALKTDTASLKVATAGAATAGNMTALQTTVGALSKTITGVQSDLSQEHTCLPELDQEVNTLGINTNTGNILLDDGTTDTFLTGAYINNPTVISNNCTKFLTGQ